MTLAAVPSYIGYTATAGQTVFPVPFRVFASADLEVYLNTIPTTAWSLSGVGNPTCTLTMLAPLAAGDLLQLRRVTARQQLTDYIPNDAFGAESHEAALDRLSAQIQDLLEELSRRPALLTSVSPALRGLALPPPGSGQVIGWNGLGTALATFPPAVQVVSVNAGDGLAFGETNVRLAGAVGTGLVNDAPAIQAAITQAQTTGLLKIHFPPGSYRLDSPVTITNQSVQFVGDGMEITKLLVNNSTGGITFSSTGQPQANGGAHQLQIRDMTFVAIGSGSQNRGYAVKATWPGPSQVPDTLHTIIERVGIRSTDYDSLNTAQPHFTKGLWLINPQNSRLSDLSIIQINNAVGDMIHLDCAATASCFRFTLRGLEILGGLRGLYATGWIENIQLTDFEIVGQVRAIVIDGTTSNVTNPALLIANGHANALLQTVVVTKWADVHLTNLSLYVFPVAAATTVQTVFTDQCRDVTITGCRFGSGSTPVTAVSLIELANTQGFAIGDNVFEVNHDTLATIYQAIAITNSSALGVLADNVVRLSGIVTNSRGFLLQPGLALNDQLTVHGNRFENIGAGIVVATLANALITNNVYIGTGTAIAYIGTQGSLVRIRGNHPFTGRLVLTTNSATPSIAGAEDGLVTLQNTGATVITNITGGYEGMLIELLAANGNTTLTHNANLVLAGSVNLVMATSTIVTLRLMGATWREVARRLP